MPIKVTTEVYMCLAMYHILYVNYFILRALSDQCVYYLFVSLTL